MFECRQCKKSFDCLYKLMMHRTTHDVGRVASDYSCPVCVKVFLSERNLENHIRLLHTRETPFHCQVCNKPFLRKDHLMNHELTHKDGLHCKKCGEIFKTTKALNDHGLSHRETKSFDCHQCPKKYTRNEHLQTHLLSHSSELEYSCPYCSDQFWRESHLSEHVKIHKFNKETNECVCLVCESLVDAMLLKEHMKDKHQGSNMFHCKLCDKSFMKKGNLVFHNKTHLNYDNKS